MGKTHLLLYTRLLIAVIMMAMGGAVWADDEVIYTLATQKEEKNNGYTQTYTIDINTITWKAVCSMNFPGYWRFGGGKGTGNKRTLQSTTPLNSAISEVIIHHQGISNENLTINSVKLEVTTDANFESASIIETVTSSKPSFGQNVAGTITFKPKTLTRWPTGCYFRFTINYTHKQSSNCGLNISSIDFYGIEESPALSTIWQSSSLAYTEETQVSTVTEAQAPVGITFAQGKGNNGPAYHLSSTAKEDKTILFDRDNTLTLAAKEGYAVSGITIRYWSSKRQFTPSIGTYDAVQDQQTAEGIGTWTGCSPHITLTNTSGIRLFIHSITANYIKLAEAGTVTVSSAGAATYCPTDGQPIVVGNGTLTNIITGVENGVVKEENIPVVPSGTGVMLHGAGTYKCYTDSRLTEPTIATNYLVGETAGGYVPVGSYALQNQEGEGLGFYPVETEKYTPISAGKAYLTLPSGFSANLRALFFNQADAEHSTTAIQSPRFDSHSATTFYNLNGLPLKAPQKGINIIRKADGTIRKVVTP